VDAEIDIRALTLADVPSVSNLLCKCYSHLGVPQDEFRTYADRRVPEYADVGLSLVAVPRGASDKVLGFMLCEDYVKEGDTATVSSSTSGPVPAAFQPLFSFIDTLVQKHKNDNPTIGPGNRLYVIAGCTDALCEKRGIGLLLRSEILKLACQRKFNGVLEATALATHHMWQNKLSGESVAEEDLASFQWNGQRPFQGIQGSASSVVLMERLVEAEAPPPKVTEDEKQMEGTAKALDCERMFGDCATGALGIHQFADLNPLRWSGSLSIPKAIEQLRYVEKKMDRPIILKVPSGVRSSEIKLDNIEAAVNHLEGQLQKREKWRESVALWKKESQNGISKPKEQGKKDQCCMAGVCTVQ